MNTGESVLPAAGRDRLKTTAGTASIPYRELYVLGCPGINVVDAAQTHGFGTRLRKSSRVE